MSKETIRLAKEWAEMAKRGDLNQVYDRTDAAIRTIEGIPDEYVDAEALREVLDEYRHRMPGDITQAILNLLPKSRTLADMSAEERKKCQGKPAKVAGFQTWYIVGEDTFQPGWWIVTTETGRIDNALPEQIEPFMDKPGIKFPPHDEEQEDNWQSGGLLEDSNIYSRGVDADPSYMQMDRDGDIWEQIDGEWATGETHADRVQIVEDGIGLHYLPEGYAPYRQQGRAAKATIRH